MLEEPIRKTRSDQIRRTWSATVIHANHIFNKRGKNPQPAYSSTRVCQDLLLHPFAHPSIDSWIFCWFITSLLDVSRIPRAREGNPCGLKAWVLSEAFATNCRLDFWQSTLAGKIYPGPAECAKRLNEKFVMVLLKWTKIQKYKIKK